VRIHHRAGLAGFLTTVVAGVLVAPTSAHAAGSTAVVHAGQSIQAAIDAAPAYGTVLVDPGTYAENLLVTKPLEVRGRGLVRLVPPADVTANRCTEDEDADLPEGDLLPVGICVLGVLGGPADPTGDLPSVLDAVPDVHLVGLEISGFAEGVETDGTDRLELRDLTLRDNEDGVDSFYGTGTVFERFRVTGAEGFGSVSLQRSRDVRVTDSEFWDNTGFGLSLVDTRGATVAGSTFRGSAGGIAVTDTPAGERTGDLRITGNAITDNDGFFPGDGEAPPASGIGIALVGAQGAQISGNLIRDNVPSGDTPFSGFGIGIFDADQLTGGDSAHDVHASGNRITGSPVPVLDASASGDNVIRGNRLG
jgi:nitrous oxidase accessory protein NosD